MQTTVYDLGWMSAQRHPKAIAIVDSSISRRVSYGSLMTEVDSVAAGLSERGIAAGDLVGTALGNTVEHAVVLLALARLGAIPTLLNPRAKTEELLACANDGALNGLVALDNAELLTRASAETAVGTLVGVRAGELAALRGDRQSLGDPVRPAPDDPAFVFYTSGTTGLPKGVVIPHRATEPRVLFMALQGGLGFGRSNRLIGLMPLHHVIGFYAVLVACLAFNGTWYAVPSFDPTETLDLIESERITCVFASPTHFHALLDSPRFSHTRTESVETVIYAGAPMNAALRERVAASFDAPLREIYGTTEMMNSLFGSGRSATELDASGNVTHLQPGFGSRVRVVDKEGDPATVLRPGEEGELIVDATGDAAFLHYLNRPGATAAKVVSGWYRTGDAAQMDETGDVFITGRVDDMILSGAENIHPEEVEGVLLSHPQVLDAAVVGVRHGRWGEIVVGCVVTSSPRQIAEALDGHCRSSHLADYKRPRGYLALDHIPRNAANKVLRRTLREHVIHAATCGAGPGLAWLEPGQTMVTDTPRRDR